MLPQFRVAFRRYGQIWLADIDLEAHYWRERRPLFGLFMGAVAVSVAREWQLEGRLPEPENLLFHGIFFAVGLTGFLSRGRRTHAAIALGLAAVIIVYVVVLFTRLQGR